MEPLSALSFACNVLELVDKGIKCGKVIYKLYKDGVTDDQDDLEAIADTMEAVVAELQTAPNKANIRKSSLDPSLAKLLTRSTTLCAKLRDLVKKCQPELKGSLRAAGVAVLRRIVHKSDIEALEKDLETCRASLALMFSTSTHQNVSDMKADLEAMGMTNDRIYTKIGLLDDRFRDSTDDLRKELETLLTAFREAQDAIKEKQILKSLAFTDMDGRFISIHEAEEDTFNWVFNDPDSLITKEPLLTTSFTDWLKTGSEIFHIVGKPGSGKSTLMKYLCEQPETNDYLQEWATTDGKELIFCKFFFWRITTVAEQKTLKGLIRGLLHGVLSQVPSLSRQLFPRRWEVRKGVPQQRPWTEVGDREILDAFEALMKDTTIFEDFRLCFFIDGLDEFEQNISLQRDTHASLATKLQRWASSSNGNVKMCVSSRPLLEFVNIFPASQQITLQKLTEDDICTLVTGRLESNDRFIELKKSSEDENCRCDKLLQKILEEAEGVFLWVVLVLSELEQALANLDSLDVLERIVVTAHKELKDFVHNILLSIPRVHRQGSYYLLAVVMRLDNFLTSESKAVEALRDQLDEFSSNAKGEKHCINLAECAMLFDAADRGKLLDCDGDLAIITPGTQEKKKEQLIARCRSLVEVDPNQHIRFTHRAIPEALQDIFFGNHLEEPVHDDKVAEILIWIALADIKLQWENMVGEIVSDEQLASINRASYTALSHFRMYPISPENSKRMMQLLYSIQEAILGAQYGTATPEDDVMWNNWSWVGRDKFWARRCLRLGVFDLFQLHEFYCWLIDEVLSLKNDRKRLFSYLCATVLLASAEFSSDNPASFESIFSKLLQHGLTLDVGHAPGNTHSNCQRLECQLWHEFLCRELHYGMTHRWSRKFAGYLYEDQETRISWKGLEILLRFGPDPDVYLATGQSSDERVLLGPTDEILYSVNKEQCKKELILTDHSQDLEFIELPESGKISLAEFVKLHHPPNTDRLLQLIQQGINKKAGRSALAVPTVGRRRDSDEYRVMLSKKATLAAEEPRQVLVPRQTW